MARRSHRPLPLHAVQQERGGASKDLEDPAGGIVADVGEQQVLRPREDVTHQAARHERRGGGRRHQLCSGDHPQATPAKPEPLRLHADESVNRAGVIDMHQRRQLLVVPRILEEHALEVRVERDARRSVVAIPRKRPAKQLQHPRDVVPFKRANQVHAPCCCSPRSAATSCLPLGSRGNASRTS